MSDQAKKRSTEVNNPSNPTKRSKLQQPCTSSATATNSKSQPRDKTGKPSEYDDTGWMTPSEFAKSSSQRQSQSVDPQKDCEEAVRLLSEFTQQAIHPTGESVALSEDANKTSKTPARSIQTISKSDLASISFSDTLVTSNEGAQTDARGGVQFGQSPGSSMSSPGLIISTTPPKKRGIKKRKLQGDSTTGFQRSLEKKSKMHKTPEKSNKLMIATRQLIHKTPSKSDPQTSGKKSTSSPRKSARLASLDHRISWKKGKKKIKKLTKKKTTDESDDEDHDEGEFEESFDLQFDSELEARLEENAAKNNLTAINVKSILHHVITNEHVLQMVRNTMQDLESEPNQPGTPEKEPAVYEPKLTRSKLKEVTEKVGGDAIAWPLTPVKKPGSSSQFAELDFPEDSSEDEDYKPSHDDTVESDYESIASSQHSNFGSPCPSTPRSLSTSFLDEDETSPSKMMASTPTSTTPTTSKPKPVVKHIPAAAVPMGPPVARPRIDNRMKDDINFFKQLDSFDAELKSMQETIAHRTRAKHPINQTVEEIEASFIPPDIAHDMYDSDTDDKDDEWVAWLAGLNQATGPESVEPPDDEQNDPEYNFLAEEETVDTEDFRDDKAVRVSKKELDELMDELFEAYGNEVDLQQAAQTIVPNQYNQPVTLGSMIEQQRQAAAAAGGSPTISAGLGLHGNAGISPAKEDDAGANATIIMSDSERQQLQQQMQQHVQLLCQMNVLSRACNNVHKDHHTQAKKFLNELDYLANNFEQVVFGVSGNTSTQPLPYYSFFRTCNLQEACDIANNPLPGRVSSAGMTKQERNLNMPMSAMDVMVNSTVFMYPELLPTCKLLSTRDEQKTKLKFTDSEDNLIVLGMDQFRTFTKLEDKMKLIQEHMMPTKTAKQLLLHVKNRCSARAGENVIKLYRKHRAINSPPVPCEPVQPGMATAPSQLYENRKPDWLKRYTQIFKIKNIEEQLEEGKESSEESFQKIDLTNPDKSSNVSVRKLEKKGQKVKPKKPPKKIQPRPQETDMEVESESSVFVQESGGDVGSGQSVGQGNVSMDSTAVDQGNIVVGQVSSTGQIIVKPNSVISQVVQVAGKIGQVGSTGSIVVQPNSALGQDGQVVGQAGQDVGPVNPTSGGMIPLTVSTQPVQNMQQPNSFQVVGGASTQPTVMPVSSVSPTGTLVTPANTSQQLVYITINPNPGFQNRLPLNPPRPPANPVQVTAAYPQVYTAVQRPVIRFQQQPTVYIATTQPSAPEAPSLIVQSPQISPTGMIQVVNTTVATTMATSSSTQQGDAQPSSSKQHLVKIKPKPTTPKAKPVSKSSSSDSSMEEIDKSTKPDQGQQTDITDTSMNLSSVTQSVEKSGATSKEPPVTKMKPPADVPKEPPAKQHLVKIKPKPKAPKPKSSKLVASKSSDDSSQEDIDKAKKLLDDVRKRISSGEEDKAKKTKVIRKGKKKGRPKMRPQQTPEQKKQEEEKAKKLLEEIKTKLETYRKEKESQSSSGNESSTSEPGEPTTEPSMDVTHDESDTQQFFPVLSPSPDKDKNNDDKELHTDGQNHNRKVVEQTKDAIPIDIISPSTTGTGNQLKRRVLFQKTTAESDDKVAADEQLDERKGTAVEEHAEIQQGSKETQTEKKSSATVVDSTDDDNQQVEQQAESTQSIGTQIDIASSQSEQPKERTRRESNTQTDPEISAPKDVDEPQHASSVTSPLARSLVQTQAVQTPSPPVNVQPSTQVRTPTYVQSPIPAVNQSITVPNSNITFHSPPVSNFPPQLTSKEGGKSTPSPPAVGKSPKGISALRNFKIDQGTVARQSPVTSPAAYQENKPKTARKLIENDNQDSSPGREESTHKSLVADEDEQHMEVDDVEAQSEADAVGSKNTEEMLQQEGAALGGATLEDPLSNPTTSVDDGKSGVPESSKTLLCEEPTLSDDELKPLSKEEEEFCDADEEEAMEDEEEDDVENDDADDEVTESTAEVVIKQSSPPPGENTTAARDTQVSPSPSEKSAHSDVCTPPSNKAGSQEPSPSTKHITTVTGEEEDPQSPETEDALTSPEVKSKSDGDHRPTVTFEDSNSMDTMDTFHSGSNPHTNDGYEEDMEDSNQGQFEDGKLKDRKSKRIAAKRIKTKLKKDLESTVVLLDPEIVANDPLREERDDSFSKAYLKSVKEALKDDLPKYIEFLRILNDFTDEQHPDMVKLYHSVCTVLAEYESLIEEFTAFLPQEVASQCGVLIPNMEFAKARLFLRQMEVHFSKQPTHFQKILSLIIEWGSREDRTNQQLKDMILPQLKGQPHLKQEFSLLFPDNAPPETHMMDFEYITLCDDDSKEYDSFEEIEVSDSEEERCALQAAAAAKKKDAKKNKKRKLKAEIRKKRRKGGVIDPWKGLNAELQYGTHSCKCSCHDKSLDTRVQRKIRHCAYCSAGVSTEVISSFKGLKPSSRRPLSKSQLDMFDDNSNAIDGPEGMLAARKRSSGKSRKSKKNDSEDDVDDDDDEDEDDDDDDDEDDGSKDGHQKRTYSAAVSHLSEMCDNLADILNEHGNTSDDDDDDDEDLEKYTDYEKESDDEKETEYEKETEDEKESCDDKETEDEKDTEDDEDHDEDDDDDDIHDDDDVDDDIDVEDDMDVDDGVETGEDAEDEDEGDDDDDEDDVDMEKDIQKDDDAVNSPYATSQESHSGDESDGSNPASPHTPQSENEQKIHSEVGEDGTSQDGNSKGAPTQDETCQDDDTMDALPENQPESREKQISPAPQISKDSKIAEQTASAAESIEKDDRTKEDEAKDVQIEQDSEPVEDAKKDKLSDKSVEKDSPKDDTHPRGSQVIPKENAETTDNDLTKESVIAISERTVETDNPQISQKPDIKTSIIEDAKETALSSKTATEQVPDGAVSSVGDANDDGDASRIVTPLRPDGNHGNKEEVAEDVGDGEAGVEKDATPDLEKSSEADDEKQEDTTIVWTREDDRLLLQACQMRDPNDSLFAEIAGQLQDKTVEQVTSRFHILMQLFNSSQGEEAEEEDDEEGDDDEDEDGDDEEEESEEDGE